MGLSAEQVPYTGQKGSDATKHDDTAPTIEALKRAMVRLGFLNKKLSELDGYWAAGLDVRPRLGRVVAEEGLPGRPRLR